MAIPPHRAMQFININEQPAHVIAEVAAGVDAVPAASAVVAADRLLFFARASSCDDKHINIVHPADTFKDTDCRRLLFCVTT